MTRIPFSAAPQILRRRSVLEGPEIPTEEEESLLKKFGHTGLNLLVATGAALDLPGSMVRDVLGGENPFDQLFSPFSFENRLTGRDLLEKAGALKKNKPGLDVGDVVGFGVEVLIDPLTWVGMAPLTKGGRIVSKAGGMGAVRRVASKKLGKMVGKSTARIRTRLSDVVEYAARNDPALFHRLARAARTEGTTLREAMKSEEALGGMLGLVRPLSRKPFRVFGQGRKLPQTLSGSVPLFSGENRARIISELSHSLDGGDALKIGGLLDSFGGAWANSRRVDAEKLFEKLDFSKVQNLQEGIHSVAEVIRRHLPEVSSRLTKKVEKALHVEKGKWTPEAKESFRLYLERYLRDGLPPHPALSELFGAFRESLQKQYPSVVGTQIELPVPSSLREAFDELFSKAIKEPGKAGFAERLADRMGRAGMAIGSSTPGVIAQQLFRPAIHGKKTVVGREAAKHFTELERRHKATARRVFSRNVARLVKDGRIGSEDAQLLRQLGERVIQKDDPQLMAVVEDVTGAMEDVYRVLKYWGIDISKLNDEFAEYWPRFITKSIKGKGQKPLIAFDPSSLGRHKSLRDIVGGTERIRQVALDDEIRLLLRDPSVKPKEVARAIEERFGQTFKDLKHGSRFVQVLRRMSDETLDSGIFGNHPLVDVLQRLDNAALATASAKAVMDAIIDFDLIKKGAKAPRADTVTLRQIFAGTRMVPGTREEGAIARLAERMGVELADNKAFDQFARKRVPRAIAEDLRKMIAGFTSPEPAHRIMQVWDSITNLFRSSVTSPWPAFQTRNLVSGQFMNWLLGQWSGRSVRDAWRILRGKVIKDAAEIPEVRRRLAAEGIEATDANATDMIRRMIFEQELVHRQGEYANIIGSELDVAPEALGELFPGGFGGSRPFRFRRVAKQFSGLEEGTTLIRRPRIRGVAGAQKSTFGPVVAGETIGAAVEGMNRIAPFIHNLRKGFDPIEAALRAKTAQIDYSAKAFTNFERAWMTRLFPFYKFQSRVAGNVFKMIGEHPGGKLSQVIQLTGQSSADARTVPEYVAQTAAIPVEGSLAKLIGEPPEGADRYLTGFGFMHEDPLSLPGTPKDTLLELGSRLNPILKFPLEVMTGQTFFQRSVAGGRPLEDLDPVIGRTIANVQRRKGRVRPFISREFEHFVLNTPISRLLTSLRTATDPRKKGLARAMNLLTGFRITDVSEASQDAIIREAIQRAMRREGAAKFEKVYFREEELQQMTPGEREFALKMQRLMNILAERAKQRAREQAAS